MTDTRTPGLITPDNAPRLADLDDDSTPYPTQLCIFCDECGTENTADYLVAAESTKSEQFEVARTHLRTVGWFCTPAGDYCPDCVKAGAVVTDGSPADYETKVDRPACPDCGNGCGGHASEIYHVDCGKNVADCTCAGRETVSSRQLLANPAVTDATELVITAGELRKILDECGQLRQQAAEDAMHVGWYLYGEGTAYEMRLAVLANRFGKRAKAALEARQQVGAAGDIEGQARP
ncbi:hypothetical protein Caci_3016 [Catenulispora acidiphila DSM 44928]|uniref:Uncharacterized protein n=1 Tax=Catenulispora acidiphila (strain DSM 44928 / JCM 14897 / NBRC 102108 / NRRL B-24433 / ID139908) TaxID=479433 RepID=C7Q4F6_CATAD|nr:hypothetical protein [Catenulispora acidiphila]ACU71925.1 hypothetical protein Caci_3016 [Catenulispora acidiphila DSM 44928]